MKRLTVSAITGALALSLVISPAFAQVPAGDNIGAHVTNLQTQQLQAVERAFSDLGKDVTTYIGLTNTLKEAKRIKGGWEITEKRVSGPTTVVVTMGSVSVAVWALSRIANAALTATPYARYVANVPKASGWTAVILLAAATLPASLEGYSLYKINMSDADMLTANAALDKLDSQIAAKKAYIVTLSSKITGVTWNPDQQVINFSGVPNLPANLQNMIGNTGGTVSLMDLTKLFTVKALQH